MDIGTYAESIGFKDISGKGMEENQELKSTSETGSDPAPATPGKKGAEVNQATFVLGCLMGERDPAAAAGEVTKDQQFVLQTIQEMTNAFSKQQSTVKAQQDMASDIPQMGEEVLRRFRDGKELLCVFALSGMSMPQISPAGSSNASRTSKRTSVIFRSFTSCWRAPAWPFPLPLTLRGAMRSVASKSRRRRPQPIR